MLAIGNTETVTGLNSYTLRPITVIYFTVPCLLFPFPLPAPQKFLSITHTVLFLPEYKFHNRIVHPKRYRTVNQHGNHVSHGFTCGQMSDTKLINGRFI